MNAGVELRPPFATWVAVGPRHVRERFVFVADLLVPVLTDARFEWVSDGVEGQPQQNAIHLERRTRGDRYDFISIICDHYYRPRFKVVSGTKMLVEPHQWILAGDLVTQQTDLDSAKWWGAPWWSVSRRRVFERRVRQVRSLLPELIEFLDAATASPNTWKHTLPK